MLLIQSKNHYKPIYVFNTISVALFKFK